MNCPHTADHGLLLARFDTGSDQGPRAWRCYASSTLDASLTKYVRGTAYWTQDAQLRKVLLQCASSDMHARPANAWPVAAFFDTTTMQPGSWIALPSTPTTLPLVSKASTGTEPSRTVGDAPVTTTAPSNANVATAPNPTETGRSILGLDYLGVGSSGASGVALGSLQPQDASHSRRPEARSILYISVLCRCPARDCVYARNPMLSACIVTRCTC